MRIQFIMSDEDDGRVISVAQEEIEFLDDLLELFLTFTKACGYTYVERIGADKGADQECWTVR